jgi:hypothetical protein
MLATCRLFTAMLVCACGVCLHAADPIKTPFELVPLWSEEMLRHLTGSAQPACSGPNAGTCEQFNPGVCDGTAYLTLSPSERGMDRYVPDRSPAKQTRSANPQAFGLRIENASYGYVTNLHEIVEKDFETIDLLFECQYSGNDACHTSRFHLGAVQAVEIGLASGDKIVDLTGVAAVLPEGKVAVPVDRALRQSLFTDPRAVYKVRAAVECFTVRPSPVEWVLPVREAPSPDARALGAVIARVTYGSGLDLVYRPNDGEDVPFEADWVEQDWGYTYFRDQTILDRTGDWFLLPPRPFPSAVWIHLPGRGERSSVSEGTVYSLSKAVEARVTGASGTVTLDAGNIVVVAVHGRTLEIREEEDVDGPCAGSDERAAKPIAGTYLVDAEEFYDGDLHLQLRPAYTRGC